MRMVKMVIMSAMMWTVLRMRMVVRMMMRMMRMMMKQDSTSPGFLWVFGTRQRTKWGSQL